MRTKKLIALLICGMAVVALLVTGTLLSTHIGHNCAGDHCLVCSAISGWKNLLRSLAAWLIMLGFMLPGMLGARIGRPASPCSLRSATPVALKVKLLN